MLFVNALISGLLAVPSLAASGGSHAPSSWGLFSNNVIYQPGKGQTMQYPRYVELQDGTLLATVTFSPFNPQFFPVFESKDGGATWTWVSNITDQVNGWGLQAQPALAELTEPLGGYPAGTILASGNSENRNTTATGGGTRIDLYASRDRARSWEFVSHIAMGGQPNTTNGETPIWEPYLMSVTAFSPFYQHTDAAPGCMSTSWWPTTRTSAIRSTGRSSRTRRPPTSRLGVPWSTM